MIYTIFRGQAEVRMKQVIHKQVMLIFNAPVPVYINTSERMTRYDSLDV